MEKNQSSGPATILASQSLEIEEALISARLTGKPHFHIEGPFNYRYDMAALETEDGKSELGETIYRYEHKRETSSWSRFVIEVEKNGCYIQTKFNTLHITADTQNKAQAAYEKAMKTLKGAKEKTGPFIELVFTKKNEVDSREVAIQEEQLPREESLQAHYGEDVLDWEKRLLTKIKTRGKGIVLFEGTQGTGKTTYIRRLATLLADTHQFFWVNSRDVHFFQESAGLEFWIDRTTLGRPLKKTVILLEDAEDLLLPRVNDGNATKTSTILNLSDGILGDLVEPILICSCNQKVEKLDPAVLRPGRLLDRRHFRKLNRQEAETLAKLHNTRVPSSSSEFTLAEIVFGEKEPENEKVISGFSS